MQYLQERPHPEELDRDALAAAFRQVAGEEEDGDEPLWSRPSLRSDAPYHDTKFTWHRVKLILEKLEKGMSKTSAAEAAGLAKKTLMRWQEQGRTMIDEAAVEERNWKPALELLQRTRKERCAKHRSIERTTRHEGTMKIELNTPERPDPQQVDEGAVRELAENLD